MATRDVQIRVSVDDADAVKKLDELAAKLDKLSKGTYTVKVRLDDGGTSAKLDALLAKLDKFGAKDVTAKVGVDGATEASAEMDKLSLQLDRFGHKRVTADVRVKTSGALSKDVKGLLGDLGGGGGGSIGKDAAAAAGAGGGGAGSGILSALGGANNSYFGALIGGLIAYAMSIAPAIIPFGLGGLTGGGAALLAGRLGTTGLAALHADRQALAQAQAATQGRFGNTPSARLALQQAQAQLARDQAKYGGFVPFGQAMHGLQGNLLDSLLTAVTGKGLGFSAGPHGQQGGSFLQGLVPILQQIGAFAKSIGPQLGDLFRASLPSLSAFVKIGEQFAKAILPAMTQSLKALGPSLPTIVQGFKYLSQGIAGFIRDLGPGMKDAAIIFKGSMMVVKGLLQLVGAASSAFAIAIVKTAEFVRTVARDIPRYFDKMRHDVASIFDAVRHDIAAAWDAVYQNTIGRVGRMVQSVMNFDANLRHGIASDFDSIRHTIAATWDAVYAATIGKVSSLVSTVVHWFAGLPGKIVSALASLAHDLFSIGANALHSLLSGLESALGGILSFAAGIGSKIAGAIGGSLGGIGGLASKVLHFAKGGTIAEPIVGRGLNSGSMYTFGEGGLRERVTPLGASVSHGGGGDVYNIHPPDSATDPDAYALAVVKAIRKYKIHHGNAPLGIA